jgi:hypothetical protein
MRCPRCGRELGDGMLPARCPSCGHNLANLESAPGAEEGARRAAEAARDARAAGTGRSGAPRRAGSGGTGRHVPVLALLGVVAAIAVTALVSWRLELWGGASLPDVVGWNVERAEAKLEDAGYDVRRVERKDDGAEGIVLDMQPSPGSRRDPSGTTVTLYVSVSRRMPDVVGLSQADAEKALTDEGLTYRVDQYPDDGEAGIVLVQSDTPGTVCTSDRSVAIGVSRPRAVPSVMGLDQQDAVAALEAEGLTAKVEKVRRTSDDQTIDTVISCDPAEGTTLTLGSEVIIGIASAQPEGIEEAARGVISAVYECSSPSDSAIGGALRPYVSSSLSGRSDHDLWFGLVKRGGGLHADAGEQIDYLPRHLRSVGVQVDGTTVTCTITVTWDWSSMGEGYEGVTSTDTRTVTLGFDDDAKLTSFSDLQTDVPYYELS